MPYFGAYSATKFAQLGLSEALRVELRPQRIAVTSVHPIGTDTEFFVAAEDLSKAKIPARNAAEVHQTPVTVARKMIRAIECPRPEVWPFWPARFALVLAVLWPRLADWMMSKHRKALAEQVPS